MWKPGRRALAVAGGVTVLALLGVGLALWSFRTYEPDPRRYPVRGIDVSHHQGVIDWEAVKADGMSFAYIKASEGRDHRDDRFEANWRGARKAGLKVGAYHFFTFCSSGRQQAANLLAAMPHEADALPVAVDLEFGGNCATRPDKATLAYELSVFLKVLEAREGRAAILYVTPQFDATYGDVLPQRGLWRRSILHRPPGKWVIWQYHNRGRVAGVTGPVDINVFAGKLEFRGR